MPRNKRQHRLFAQGFYSNKKRELVGWPTSPKERKGGGGHAVIKTGK